jgi:hypothetical protein
MGTKSYPTCSCFVTEEKTRFSLIATGSKQSTKIAVSEKIHLWSRFWYFSNSIHLYENPEGLIHMNKNTATNYFVETAE